MQRVTSPHGAYIIQTISCFCHRLTYRPDTGPEEHLGDLTCADAALDEANRRASRDWARWSDGDD